MTVEYRLWCMVAFGNALEAALQFRWPATSDTSPSTASPTRNRSGTGPLLRPNAVRSASCCGPGRPSSRSSTGASS